MAKRQSFAEKSAHAQSKHQRTCPVCGAAIRSVRWVAAEVSSKNAFKFNHKMVNVCKCNEKEIYG
ncbi:hypothetical protein KAU04_08175 [bacterium]|nr:hypothetical protein [bacterium]MCK4598005.1 hypothetical protein [bacterium]